MEIYIGRKPNVVAKLIVNKVQQLDQTSDFKTTYYEVDKIVAKVSKKFEMRGKMAVHVWLNKSGEYGAITVAYKRPGQPSLMICLISFIDEKKTN